MFAAAQAVIVPVVANPHVEHHGAVLARLASVFAEQGLNTLVVDAADTAPEPGELAFIDLGACVEPLSPQLAYLAPAACRCSTSTRTVPARASFPA